MTVARERPADAPLPDAHPTDEVCEALLGLIARRNDLIARLDRRMEEVARRMNDEDRDAGGGTGS